MATGECDVTEMGHSHIPSDSASDTVSLSVSDTELRRCRPQCNCIGKKMAAGLTRDIKIEALKLSFDSAAEIAEEISLNV